MPIIAGIAAKVQHATEVVTVGSGDNRSQKTIHTVLFRIDNCLLTLKRQRQIPIAEGDVIGVICNNATPALVRAYKVLNHRCTDGLSYGTPLFWGLISFVGLILSFFYTEYLPQGVIPNTRFPVLWAVWALLAVVIGVAALMVKSTKTTEAQIDEALLRFKRESSKDRDGLNG